MRTCRCDKARNGRAVSLRVVSQGNLNLFCRSLIYINNMFEFFQLEYQMEYRIPLGGAD